MPPLLRRFASPDEGVFVPLEDVIAANLDRLFPGMEIVDHHAFRVTRNADLEVDDDGAEDLLEALEEELRKRRFSPAVRLEVEADDARRTCSSCCYASSQVAARTPSRRCQRPWTWPASWSCTPSTAPT